MPVTLEDLEKRLESLEQVVALLRNSMTSLSTSETAAERGLRARQQARDEAPLIATRCARIFAQMGIPAGPSVTAEELQRLMVEDGIRAEDNAASREIMAMREE